MRSSGSTAVLARARAAAAAYREGARPRLSEPAEGYGSDVWERLEALGYVER